MKTFRALSLFSFIAISIHASASQYAIIRMNYWGSFKLIYVDKPKNLARWHYDSKHDVYYHGQNYLGLALPVFFKDKAPSSEYVYIKPGFWWGVKVVSTVKPEVTDKWQFDTRTNKFYRGRNGWGVDCGVTIIDKAKD